MKVKDLLEKKSRNLVTVRPENSLSHAMKIANEHKIGALLVIEDERLVGIITERDILRQCSENSALVESTKVEDVMTRNVIITLPDDDLQYVMGIMTSNKIRHLPVMVREEVVGIISIGDVVNSLFEESEVQNRYLTQYIQGG